MFGSFYNTVFGHDDDVGVAPLDGSAEQPTRVAANVGTRRLLDSIHAFGSMITGTHGSQRTGNVVAETPPRSVEVEDDAKNTQDDDDANDSGESVAPNTTTKPCQTLRFKLLDEDDDETERVDYLSKVLNWTAQPYVVQLQLRPGVQFGPYNQSELINAVKNAADAAGFSLYAHRGARKSATSCSLKFGCDHARHRYGKEKVEIDSKNRDFVKDLQEVVKDQPGKRKRARKSGGYKRSHTKRQRVKSKHCKFNICVRSCGDHWSPDTQCMWTLNGDARCASCYNHSNHCKRPFKTRMSAQIKEYIIEHGERMLTSDLVQHIFKKYGVDLTADQVKYVLRKNNVKNISSGRNHTRAGDVYHAVRYLMASEASEVVLLLICYETGFWFTGVPTDNTCDTFILSPYDLPKTNLYQTDPTRELMINGTKYFVWCSAWNYRSESELFSAYPHVAQLDCMHGVTKSTDGFNAVGIDGNGHNIQLMRAYVGNQDSNVFGWLFFVAFPKLVPCYQSIRAFFCDGCKAMNAALRQACCSGQPFENAKVFRCIFHLIIKAFEDKFRCGDGWQHVVKKFLYRLRRCESEDEFTSCSQFVMRSIAELHGLGTSRSALRASVLAFVQRRIDCSKLWVLMYQLKVTTRGCLSTSRVEGTHGRDRVDDRLTARNSWMTSVRRSTEGSSRRMRARVAWSRRQIGSQLLRTPMNPEDSVFQKKDLDAMDAEMLPWAVETVEDQAALGRNMKVVFTKKGTTKQTKSQDRSRDLPLAGEFKVWFDESDASDADCDANLGSAGEVSELSDTSESNESTSGDADSSDSSAIPSPKKKDHNDDSSSDSSDYENDHSGSEFDVEDFMEKCSNKPLNPNHKFHWTRVRTVTMAPFYDNATRNTGKYLVTCSCGLATRIGVVFRHVFAVLFYVLCNNPRNSSGSSDSSDDDERDPRLIDWSLLSLPDLCNMNIVSKVKYHAALHGQGNLFNCSMNVGFMPTIPCQVAQDFLRRFDATPQSEQHIPQNGLPSDNDDDVDLDHSNETVQDAASNTNAGDVHRREIRPTEFGVSSLVTDIWNFTNRFNPSNKNTARKLVRQRLLELQTEVKAMETHNVREEDLYRRFSKRDMFNGTARNRRQ
jgi:hypothetical protein